MNSGFVQDEFPSSVENQLDQLCDRFDELWSLQNEPVIEQFLNLVEPEQREALLRLLIPIDIEYRMRNEQTIVASKYAHLGSAAVECALQTVRESPASELIPDEVDRFPEIENYRLIERIGQGGMGTVYLAEQRKPVKRSVAVKVVKAGYHSRDVLVRFQGERQALAMMDHPNITRIIDAGSTKQGAPYFTMELVQGEPITKYCEQNELDLDDRIRLFLKVCRAVQHAHQKGIIHRDLKPSNILIDESEGVVVPKVIDFGLAKALKERILPHDQSALTFIGSLIGTPQYMSPEQAEFDPADIDTRTDIYSLGAVLYELLTGSPPLNLANNQATTPLQVLEQIRNQHIPRPSSRIKSSSPSSESAQAIRGIGNARLKQQLNNELDWIVLKALDKDPDRRYETVEALHDDLLRYLNNDPVLAKPPSSLYLFRKFAGKHRVLLITATAFVVFLIAASSIITRLYINEKSARQATEARIARARYFSAIGFWARNRSSEAINALEEIELPYRHIECRLARHQFRGNCFTITEEAVATGHVAILSGDGKQIASAGIHDLILLRDANSGELIRRIGTALPDNPVRSLAFHPSQSLIAVGMEGLVQIWNFESNELLTEFQTPAAPMIALTFSPGGRKLAASGGVTPDSARKVADPDILIWDIDSPGDPLQLSGHTARVNQVAFGADDSRLISCSHDKTIRIWNLTTGEALLTQDIGSYVMSVAWDPAGDRIATGTANNQLQHWEFQNGELVQLWRRNAHGFEGDTVESLAFSPDGTKIATGSFDRTVKIWERSSGDELETLRGHFATVVNVAYGPQSNRLLSVSRDGVLKIWDLERQTESRILKGHSQSVNAISFSPDSRWLLSAGGMNDFDSGPGSPLNSHERPDDHTIRLWDLDSGEANRLMQHTASVTDIEFNPDPDGLVWFVSSGADGQILFWEKGREAPSFALRGHAGLPVNSISFDPDGSRVASAGDDGKIRIWNINTRTEIAALGNSDLRIRKIVWNHDGTEIASVSRTGNESEVAVWRPSTGDLRWQLSMNQVNSISFDPQGTTLITVGEKLNFLDLDSGVPVQDPVKHSRLGVYFASLNQDRTAPRLLTGGREGKISIWDANSMEELADLNVKGTSEWNFVYDGHFSPDGTMIATGNRDGTIRIWDAPAYGD